MLLVPHLSFCAFITSDADRRLLQIHGKPRCAIQVDLPGPPMTQSRRSTRPSLPQRRWRPAHFAGGVQTTELSFRTKQIDISPERRSTRNTPPSPVWREETSAYSLNVPALAPSPGG